MPSAPISNRSSRSTIITTLDDGTFIDIGPAGTTQSVATMVVQFNPSIDFIGSIQVHGRIMGVAAQAANVPPVPLPYRRANLNGLASDYALVSDLITGAGIIQVPLSGLSLLFLVSCGAGQCSVCSWDLNGSSVP